NYGHTDHYLIEQYNNRISQETYEDIIAGLLKKAKKDSNFKEICFIVKQALEAIPNIVLVKIGEEIDNILSSDKIK
ncbi:MAG: hypothetical protein ABRQ37_11750, partial [Candidatus Eremiobacterota bacterium]